MYQELNEVNLNFNPDMQIWLNICLALVMFSVAISLKISDFKMLLKNPKLSFIGLFTQYFLLPLITLALVWIIQPSPYVALGMFLIAACPGGNVSNFFSYLGGGNVALSVSLSLFSSIMALVITPFQLSFWSGLWPQSASLLHQIDLSFMAIMKTVLVSMAIPMLLGITLNSLKPHWVKLIDKPLKMIAFIILIAFIALGVFANIALFKRYFILIFSLVFVHNFLAFIMSYYFAKLLKVGPNNAFTISIETGIQNTGLGLLIIFAFFNGNGAMAILAAWWGVWHIISGFAYALVFSWNKKRLKLKTI